MKKSQISTKNNHNKWFFMSGGNNICNDFAYRKW